jgi:hypothetical protein
MNNKAMIYCPMRLPRNSLCVSYLNSFRMIQHLHVIIDHQLSYCLFRLSFLYYLSDDYVATFLSENLLNFLKCVHCQGLQWNPFLITAWLPLVTPPSLNLRLLLSDISDKCPVDFSECSEQLKRVFFFGWSIIRIHNVNFILHIWIRFSVEIKSYTK